MIQNHLFLEKKLVSKDEISPPQAQATFAAHETNLYLSPTNIQHFYNFRRESRQKSSIFNFFNGNPDRMNHNLTKLSGIPTIIHN